MGIFKKKKPEGHENWHFLDPTLCLKPLGPDRTKEQYSFDKSAGKAGRDDGHVAKKVVVDGKIFGGCCGGVWKKEEELAEEVTPTTSNYFSNGP